MPRLYVMVGIPGSGKTTYARTYLRDAVRVSMDDLRAMFHGTAYDARHEDLVFASARALLDVTARRAAADGFDVVVDATHVTRRLRVAAIEVAQRYGLIPICVHVDVSVERAHTQNQARSTPVPAHVIERFQRAFEPPNADEGFSEIVVVRGI